MSASSFSLHGRRALVTGSSRGLGLAFARALAGAGAEVVLNGREPERVERARETLRAEGFSVYPSFFDVTNEAAVVAALEAIGPIDILVTNTGSAVI